MKKTLYKVSYYGNVNAIYIWRKRISSRNILMSGLIPKDSPYRVLGKYFSISISSIRDLRTLSYFDAILSNNSQEKMSTYQRTWTNYKLRILMNRSNGQSFLVKIAENFKAEDRLQPEDPLLLKKIESVIPKVLKLWDESLKEENE